MSAERGDYKEKSVGTLCHPGTLLIVIMLQKTFCDIRDSFYLRTPNSALRSDAPSPQITVIFLMTTGVTGLSPKVVRTLAISSTVSMPLTTLPKAA